MDNGERAAVKVWDLPMRIFHWALLALLVFQVVSGKLGGKLIQWHVYAGYGVFALVAFRLIWGFAGSTPARFASFLARPAAALGFARRLFLRRAEAHPGHNPLGGWMVIALLASLAVQIVTGLFSNDGISIEGPLASLIPLGLSDQITKLHQTNVGVLLALSATHTAAVLYHWLVLREDLIRAMVTGVKHLRRGDARPAPGAVFPGPARALLVLAAALALVALVVTRGA